MGDLAAKNAAAIQDKGGPDIEYQRCTVAGADVSPSDAWHPFPFQAKLKHAFTQPEKPEADRSGAQVATILEDFSIDLLVTSMEDTVALEKFLKDDVPNTYFRIISDNGIDYGSLKKYRGYGICKIERTYGSEEKGRRPEIRIIPQYNASAITFATVPTWSTASASDFVIPVGGYYIPVSK
jgi:hypothetical protein